MTQFRVWYFPLLCCFSLLVTLFVPYAISVIYKHVRPVWPYISETGKKPPESCYFAELMFLSIVVIGFTLYLRFLQLSMQIVEVTCCFVYQRFNAACLVLAIIILFGLSFVANFQISTIPQVHLAGAYFVFVGGFLYIFFQTILSAMVNDKDVIGYRLNIFRVVLCFVYIALFVMTSVCTRLSRQNYKVHKKGFVFVPGEPHYTEHIIATISQWLLVLVVGVFIMTFTYEFKKLVFDMRCFNLINSPETSTV